ncbi:MAG TPA: PqqD family peptide modification chaperone [Aestuariivirga sp.]|nr:PqqD family protein [Alphaproteobacteria bacterium]HRX36016.1 PqqD family peptide modification chaperone [Aestuariivirga sp.]
MTDPRLSSNPQTVVVRKPVQHEARLSESSLALLDAEAGKYFGLEDTAARIWQLIAEPISVRQIVDALTRDYQVDEATCRRDVATFLDELADQGLIRFETPLP